MLLAFSLCPFVFKFLAFSLVVSLFFSLLFVFPLASTCFFICCCNPLSPLCHDSATIFVHPHAHRQSDCHHHCPNSNSDAATIVTTTETTTVTTTVKTTMTTTVTTTVITTLCAGMTTLGWVASLLSLSWSSRCVCVCVCARTRTLMCVGVCGIGFGCVLSVLGKITTEALLFYARRYGALLPGELAIDSPLLLI
jgi:hypothetical protein